MAAAVARQKINLTPAYLSADQRVRGRPERCVDLVFARIAHLFHLIETAAADDPDRRNFIFHSQRDLMRKIDKMESG